MNQYRKLALGVILWACSSTLCFPLGAHAGPMGPSAKMAARLKKRPTSAWLAHYLPDDRYKIAGGVWKYVSTDLDTFYHLPDSPLVLSQPAGRVIGFASAADAEEAGYQPGPGVRLSGVSGSRFSGSSGMRRGFNSGAVSGADGSRRRSRILPVPESIVRWVSRIQQADTMEELLAVQFALDKQITPSNPYYAAMVMLSDAIKSKRAAVGEPRSLNRRLRREATENNIQAAMRSAATTAEDQRDPVGAQQRGREVEQNAKDMIIGSMRP